MRRMTEPAVLANRCVFPQVRTALLSVTLLTGRVDIQACKLGCNRVAVHVVTSHTIHLAFEERVRKRFLCLTALKLMAVEADFWLGRCVPDRICRRMHVMAIDAADLVARVSTVVPAEADIVLVTVQAHAVVLLDSTCRIRCVMRHRRPLLPPADTTGVRSAWPVAGLTLQLSLTERAVRIGRHGVVRVKYGQTCLIIVAGKAAICTLATVLGLRVRLGKYELGQAQNSEYCDQSRAVQLHAVRAPGWHGECTIKRRGILCSGYPGFIN